MKEEILKEKLGGEFDFKTFTEILTKECLNNIYDAMEEYANQFKSKNNKLLIEFDEYSHECGDGCCTNYGTITKVNGIQLELHNQDYETIVEQILTHLGYKVEIKRTYNNEEI